MIRILAPTGKRRRLAQFGTIFTAIALLALIVVPAAFAVLPGSPSKFESGNDPTLGLGNMIVTGAGNSDWVTVATTATDTPYVHITDTAASNGDDSFTPGQKQDTVCPTTEGHKNPPKDDFTDIASYTEVNAAGETFLYGATIRYAANGNAAENIELKQGTSGDCTGGLLARTTGDKLLAIDYLGGGKAVQFHVLTWVDSGPCNVSSHTAPCWGADVLSLDPNVAEGGVSTSTITAANNPINGKVLAAGQFAEFGVNLAGAGIIPAGSCKTFSQTVWESRSAGSSFVSSTKDISVEDKDINNCASVSVIKLGSDGGSQAGAVFTLYPGSDTSGTAIGSCTVADDGTCSDASFSGLSPGQYTIDETGTPAGYSTDESLPFTFDLATGENLVLTFTNVALRGAIAITKTSSKGLNPGLEGAEFEITAPDSSVTTVTSGADGTVCVDDLAFGTYSVQETVAPTGYAIDDTTAHDVTVDTNSTCGDGSEATFAATDTPLTDLVVTATGQAAPAGTTKSQITCLDSGGGDIGDSPSDNTDPATVTANGLEPGTYTCTVVIDP